MQKHNEQTYQEVMRFVKQGAPCCVVNPCGSGKTEIVTKLLEDMPDKSFLMVTKQKNAKEYYLQRSELFSRVTILTYSKVLSCVKNEDFSVLCADVYIVDEAHYLGAKKWGAAFQKLVDLYKPLMIGLTATPQRYEQQGTDKSIVTDWFDGNIAGNFTCVDLQKQKVFIEPEYVLSLYNLDEELEKRRDYLAESGFPEDKVEQLSAALDKIERDWLNESCPSVAIQQCVPRYLYKEHSNRIVVFVDSLDRLPEYKRVVGTALREMTDKRVVEYEYHYRTTEQPFKTFLKDNKGTYIKVLYTIDKVMETIHIDDLAIAIMLRPSVSNKIITQQFGRLNNSRAKHKSLILDMVGNLDRLNAVVRMSCPKHLSDNAVENKKYMSMFNFNYISKSQSLFQKIDLALPTEPERYEYKGMYGTVRTLSKICCRDEDCVASLIEKGFSIDMAIEHAPLSMSLHNVQHVEGSTLMRKVDIQTLTDEEQELVQRYLPSVQRFIERKHITDIDFQQDLYMMLFYSAKKAGETNRDFVQVLLCNLGSFYIRECRRRYVRDNLCSYIMDCKPEVTKQVFKDSCKQPTVLQEVAYNCLRDEIMEVLDTLTVRERKVMVYRYGLDGNGEKSLADVGRLFDVTMERVRQIEAKALRKLRHPVRANQLKDYLDDFAV